MQDVEQSQSSASTFKLLFLRQFLIQLRYHKNSQSQNVGSQQRLHQSQLAQSLIEIHHRYQDITVIPQLEGFGKAQSLQI